MNRILQIIAAFALLLILGAPSCVNEEERKVFEEARLQREIDKIYSEMESQDLSDSILLIYQIEAKRKLMDMSDYFQLLSDTSLAMSIRNKAADLIRIHFISEYAQVELNPLNKESGPLPLSSFLKNELDKKTPLKFIIDSIIVTEDLVKIDDETYRGEIGSHQNLQQIGMASIEKNTVFYLIKRDKLFGADTLRIWEIRFGDIK